VTMLAVLGRQGAEAVMTIDGATDAEAFWLDGAAVLRPTQAWGTCMILDKLRSHNAAGSR
jgi:hypothetical protein